MHEGGIIAGYYSTCIPPKVSEIQRYIAEFGTTFIQPKISSIRYIIT